ncbi:MAG: helix-turn-helix domain-containing protein [Acidimicrobiia bacterium]|nr:helix-turn-helix domain-containing protein [Acidimicrobiia bacterium]
MAPSRPSPFPGFDAFAHDQGQLLASLTARRRSLGLSQTEVAARMGTSQSAVARLEAGEADLRLSTLERYAAALGRRLGWVVGDGAVAGDGDDDRSAEDAADGTRTTTTTTDERGGNSP